MPVRLLPKPLLRNAAAKRGGISQSTYSHLKPSTLPQRIPVLNLEGLQLQILSWLSTFFKCIVRFAFSVGMFFLLPIADCHSRRTKIYKSKSTIRQTATPCENTQAQLADARQRLFLSSKPRGQHHQLAKNKTCHAIRSGAGLG